MASERKTPEIASREERISVSVMDRIQERIQDLQHALKKLQELDKLIESDDSDSLKRFFSSENPFLNVSFLKGRLEALNKEIQKYQNQQLEVKTHSLEKAFNLSRILKALDVVTPRLPSDLAINQEIESDFSSLKKHKQVLQVQTQYLEKLIELRDAYNKTLKEAEEVAAKLNETPFKGMLTIPYAKEENKKIEPSPSPSKARQKPLEQSPRARTREAKALGIQIKDKDKEKKITGEEHRKAKAKEFVHQKYEINAENKASLLNLGYKDSDLKSYDKEMLQNIKQILESDIIRETNLAEIHNAKADKLEKQKMQTVFKMESKSIIIKPEWILKERIKEETAKFKIIKYQEEIAKVEKILAKMTPEKVDKTSTSTSSTPPELPRKRSSV